MLPKAKISAVVALDDILMRVRDAANWRGNGGVRYASLSNATADVSGATGASDMKMAYATEASPSDPYAGFETRVVPENVTLLPKTKEQITGGNPNGERVHVVKKGDSVSTVLRDLGATADEIKAIAAHARPARPRRRHEGRREASHPDGACKPRRHGCSPTASSSPTTPRSRRSRRCPISANTSRSTFQHEYRRGGHGQRQQRRR